MKLLTHENHAFKTWVQLCDQDGSAMSHLQKRSNDIAKPLYDASVAGLTEVLYALLEMRADVNAQGGEYGNALQAASYEGHVHIAKLLIEKGADVNVQGGKYGHALQAASYGGHEAIEKLLIENGADVTAQGGYFGNALQAASYEGHEATAKLLIERGANVNAQGGKYGNALQAASYGGHEAIAKLLIENGSDINAQGGYFGNALQAASYGNHEEIAKLLIEKGADVNAQGGDYGNALQAASYEGHEGIAKLLIGKGADVNAHGGKYGNALKAASYGDHEAIAKLLKEMGADVNVQGGRYEIALQAASYEGHEAIAKLLKEKGATYSEQGKYFPSHLPFNSVSHPSSMSSKPQDFLYAHSAISPCAIQETPKNVKLTSSLKLHTHDEAKPPTDESVIGKHFVIGAESALEGIQGKEMAIEAAFNNFKISRLEYAVLAGFNEALMRSGIGYLPEIHIFCSVDITQKTESLVTKLGEILSPLPGALFTPSSTHRIPVFKNDKTILTWDELVFSRTERYSDIRSAVSPTSIQVVSHPQGSWSDGGTSAPSGFSGNELRSNDWDKKDAENDEGDDEKPGDREDNNGNPGDGNPEDEEPDDPTNGSLTSMLPVVSFDAQAKVYANTADTVSPRVFQELQVNGRLVIKVSCILFFLSGRRFNDASKSLMLHIQNQNNSQKPA